MITTEKIFNIHKNKVKRGMDISRLGGVSKLVDTKKHEFALHFPDEYDYRFDNSK